MTKEEQEIRRTRIDYELDVIAQMGFDGYFIIVWDFINWARENVGIRMRYVSSLISVRVWSSFSTRLLAANPVKSNG
jgi:DNA polymerase-3 subunit alpha